MSTTLELDLLGPVRLLSDGSTVAGRAAHRKNVALLAYLALARSRIATREQLIGVLWPEKIDQAARQSLRQALSDLRSELGEDVITTSSEGLTMGAAVVVDVDRRDELHAAGELAAAAALVRGSFMAGFAVTGENAWDDWMMSQRQRQDMVDTDLLLAHGDSLMARGRLPDAHAVIHQAMEISPQSSMAVRTAMKIHVLAGDVTRALQLYRTWHDALEQDGIDPDGATVKLAEEVRHGRRWQTARSGAAKSDMRSSIPAREAHLEAALLVWRTVAASGHSAVLCIEGDMGSGRTRLAGDLCDRARLGGATVLDCHFVAEDETDAEALIRCLARSLPGAAGLAGASPCDLAALAEYEPLLATTPADAEAVDRFEALSRILRLVADEGPVVLLFDDVGQAGEVATSLVKRLVRDLARLPVLLIVTDLEASTDPALQQLRAEAGEPPSGGVIRLGPLTVEDVTELVRLTLADLDAASIERLARRIHADTRGNLLLAGSMLSGVLGGAELEEGHGWPHPDQTLDQTRPGELPPAATGAVRTDFWRVPEGHREVLLAAAAMDERFAPDQVARAVGREVLADLDWLEWHRWIVGGHGWYLFRTRLVREIVGDDMLPAGQRDRYRSLAGLTSSPGDG